MYKVLERFFLFFFRVKIYNLLSLIILGVGVGRQVKSLLVFTRAVPEGYPVEGVISEGGRDKC